MIHRTQARRPILVVSTLGAVLLAAADAQGASFTPLGDLPGGGFLSVATGVSADGSVVVGNGFGTASSGSAFRWTASGGMVSVAPGTIEATGVSSDGNVIVGYRSSGVLEAYRWTSATGLVGLGDLPGGVTQSVAWGISADGDVVVGRSTGTLGQEAVRWTAGSGVTGLGDLAGGMYFSQALAASDDGSVVTGWSTTDSGDRAFRWTAGTGMQSLGSLQDGGLSRANDISADGTVIVGWGNSDLGNQAFRWTSSAGMVGLGQLPDSSLSEAHGVSGNGAVIVGTANVYALGEEAFVWTTGDGMRRLFDVLVARGATGLAGWSLDHAAAVSLDGRWIVGRGTNPAGDTEAFLADMAVVPIPAVGWLIGPAVAFLASFRRRRE